MSLDDVPGDGQSHSCSGNASAALYTIILLENVREVLCWNAGTNIFNADLHRSDLCDRADQDWRLGTCVLQGIGEQLPDRQLHQLAVRRHFRKIRLNLDLNISIFEQNSELA